MRRTDESIDNVLAGLRDVEAPAGMERRILNAARDQAGVKSGWVRRRLRSMWLMARPTGWSATRAWGFAFAGMMAVCVAVYVVEFRIYGVEHLVAQSDRRTIAVEVLPAVASGVVARSAPFSSSASMVRLKGLKGQASARGARVLRDRDSVALSEMRAASQPSPEMPLTEEEKLLLQIAHRGDPEELAMLDPVIRAERDAKEKAEFQNFFGPTTAGQTATGDNE